MLAMIFRKIQFDVNNIKPRITSWLNTLRRSILPTAFMRRVAAIGLIAILIAAAAIPVLPIIMPADNVEAAWYSEDWMYRKRIELNSLADQENIYYTLTIDTSDSSKFSEDCVDLRFTTQSGQIIPHHIVSGCGTATTEIQLLFGELEAGDLNVFVYYGNQSASNTAITEPFNNEAVDVTASIQAEESSVGPVAHWKFDEGYGTIAHSSSSWSGAIGSLDGTLTNGPQWQDESMCPTGKCLQFDGVDDYVDMVESEDVNLNGGITLSSWIKISKNDNGDYHTIISKDSDIAGVGRPQYALDVHTTGNLRIFGYDESGIARGYANPVPGKVLTDDAWHYVTGVFDGADEWSLYIDGQHEATVISEPMGGLEPSNLPIRIGSREASERFFNGFMDDPKIYNYPRTQAQIQQDYVAGVNSMKQQGGNLSDGLVGYWKMDEASWNGTAGEVKDASGNGNDGVAVGGAESGVGRYGNGGSFDGSDDRIMSPSKPSLYSSPNVSVATWVNGNVSGDSQNLFSGIIKTANYKLSVNYHNSGGTFSFRIYHENGQYGPVHGTTIPEANEWYFVVGLWDGNALSIYVNGELENRIDIEGEMRTTATNLMFADDNDDFTRNFNGLIDEARIYNRTLTSKEVQQIYQYAPKPVGYWDFEEGSGNTILDLSGSGIDFAWNGNGNRYDLGKIGKSGKFNGSNDFASIENNQVFNFSKTDAFTISAWIKSDSSGGVERHVISKHDYSDVDGGYLFVLQPSNNLVFDIINDLGTQYTVGASLTPYLGQWVYVTGVYDGSGNKEGISLFFNGVRVATGNNTEITGEIAVDQPMTFGKGAYLDGRYWSGSLDEVKIYNYARTQQQIIEDMQAGQLAVNTPVGSWTFDNDADQVMDSSGYDNHGTWVGTGDKYQPGVIGKAGSFNGVDDYINLGNDGSLSGFNTNFSVGFWVNPSSAGGVIYRGGENGQPWNHLLQIESSSQLRVRLWKPPGTSGDDGTNFTVQNLDLFNKWTHIFYTYDGQKINVYVNGKLKLSSSYTETLPIGSNTWIGQYPSAGTRFITGLIDEVKVYNHALTAQDIFVDYNQTSAMVVGAASTETVTTESEQQTTQPSSSASSEYCLPGDVSPCEPPIGEWRFEEGAGSEVADSSGNNNHGVWSGTGQKYEKGKLGKAGYFNGVDDVVIIPNSATLNPTTELTISAWINLAHLNSQHLIRKASSYAITKTSDGMIACWIDPGTGGIQVARAPAALFAIGKWHHIECTWKSNERGKIYLNGLEVTVEGESDVDSINLSSEGLLSLGSRNQEGNQQYMRGMLDEVLIYDYARTPSQVAWDYNKGKPVAHYKFDECQGSTLHDASGNELHGVLNLGVGGESITGTCDSIGAWSLGKSGKLNSAMSFDGVDDYVALPQLPINQNKNHFTVSGYIKPDNQTGRFIAPSSNGHDNFIEFLSEDQNLRIWLAESEDLNSRSRYTDAGSVPLNQWTHFALSINDKEVKIYLNGKLAEKFSETINIGAWSGIWHIGQRANFTFRYKGLIDDVQIFNYALTGEQVKVLHNGGAVRWE